MTSVVFQGVAVKSSFPWISASFPKTTPNFLSLQIEQCKCYKDKVWNSEKYAIII